MHNENVCELAVVPGECAVMQEPEESTECHMLPAHMLSSFYGFKLTKFVNGYFSQGDPDLMAFLRNILSSQPKELHSGKMALLKSQLPLSLDHLEALGCAPQFLNVNYSMTRLRLEFENRQQYRPWYYPSNNFDIDELRCVLDSNLTRQMKSLAVISKRKESHFPDIIRVIADSHIHIQHLEIHQSLPTQVNSFFFYLLK